MNIVNEIRAIVAREMAAPGRRDEPSRISGAIAALAGEDSGDILERFYREYTIQIGGEGLRTLAETFEWMRSLEIAAAPEVAALIPTSDRYVLVGRYWACTEEKLLSVRSENVTFREAARKRFRRDMEVLAEHGKFHPYAPRGFFHWFVGESSGTIVMDSWLALRPCSARERDQLLERLDELFARTAAPT